ncbi:hypothetical protein LSTR_LSTR016140, partial [Laodelphax striatellus]
VEREVNQNDKLYQTMPTSLNSSRSLTEDSSENSTSHTVEENGKADNDRNGNVEDISPNDEVFHDTYSQTFENSLEESSIERSIDRSFSVPESFDLSSDEEETVDKQSTEENAVVRRRTGSTSIKRRSGQKRIRNAKLKRRCSINGHFYNRETSFFTPPFGSQMSVWVTSLVSTQEVINLMLDKYKVDSKPNNFALFVVRDNG